MGGKKGVGVNLEAVKQVAGRGSKKRICNIRHEEFSDVDGKNNGPKFCLAISVESGFTEQSFKTFFFFSFPSRGHLQIVAWVCGLSSGEGGGNELIPASECSLGSQRG